MSLRGIAMFHWDEHPDSLVPESSCIVGRRQSRTSFIFLSENYLEIGGPHVPNHRGLFFVFYFCFLFFLRKGKLIGIYFHPYRFLFLFNRVFLWKTYSRKNSFCLVCLQSTAIGGGRAHLRHLLLSAFPALCGAGTRGARGP